ncbi:MAG: hypothetical protein N3A01_01100 [Bacteroidales bacterium]|nr:hypothetical protein [Bacteroidales bacterium]
MKIDTKEDYERARGTLALVTLILFSLITIGFMYDFYHDYLIPIPSWIYSIFFIIIFILYMFIRFKKKYHIIFFDDEEEPNFILIKYYPLTSASSEHCMIKIPKNALYKFEVVKSFYNLREELVIYQKTPKGIAKYNPIPITLFSKEKRKKIIETLNTYSQIKLIYS